MPDCHFTRHMYTLNTLRIFILDELEAYSTYTQGHKDYICT